MSSTFCLVSFPNSHYLQSQVSAPGQNPQASWGSAPPSLSYIWIPLDPGIYTKTVDFSCHCALFPLLGMPNCHLPGKSTLILPDAAQSGCLLEVFFSGGRDCFAPSLAALPASLQYLFHFTSLTCTHVCCPCCLLDCHSSSSTLPHVEKAF